MLFSSYTFLFQFLPATVLAFAAARRHSPRAGIMVLAGASLFFYGAWRPVYLLLLIASIAVNFALGLRMQDPLRRRAAGSFGVALNLAVLCYFKYTNFIFDSLNVLTGVPLPFVNIILPLGISFFTFQQIAYLVDVMRGARVERDIVSYTLFVSFFPHLIAGPLVHHAEMIPQFKRGRTGRSALLAARGLAIFAAGLFKKVVIADNLAQFVSPVFAHLGAGWNFLVWGGLHGIYLCINHLWRAWRADNKYAWAGLVEKGLAAKGLSWAITFFAVLVAWVFFRARTAEGAWQMLGGLFGFQAGSSAYASPGILRLMDLPILVGEERLLLIGGGAVALALAMALCLPNVPQLFGYREYRRAPEKPGWLRWRPNAAWALVSALALAISLFGMWQRLEFLYFQF